MFWNLRKLPELINPVLHCYRKTMIGKLKNAGFLL